MRDAPFSFTTYIGQKSQLISIRQTTFGQSGDSVQSFNRQHIISLIFAFGWSNNNIFGDVGGLTDSIVNQQQTVKWTFNKCNLNVEPITPITSLLFPMKNDVISIAITISSSSSRVRTLPKSCCNFDLAARFWQSSHGLPWASKGPIVP